MAKSTPGYKQLSVYLSLLVHGAFKEHCQSEGLKMSDVAESLIKKYLLDLGLIPPDDPVPISSYASFAELIKEHRQFLENHVKIPKPVIDAAVRGDRPSEVNLLKIGMALNLTQEDFDMLIEKSFPDIDDDPDKSSNGEVTNGASR